MIMIRFKNIFPSLNKFPIIQSSRVYNSILQKKNVNDVKYSFQNDKANIDKVIEENKGIYDKIKENKLYNDSMIKMLQKENQELQKENEILNEERNDLINKNDELREFLKQKFN